MQLSDRGARFIKGFEKLRLSPYRDQGGKWTVGYGHLMQPTDPKLPISLAEAEELFTLDALHAIDAVNGIARITLEQPQFDALVSLCFNIGNAAFSSSTLVRRLAAGFEEDVIPQMLRWNKTGGQRSNGLLARRAAEGLIFAFGDYG